MKKTAILGAVLLCGAAGVFASCSNSKSNNNEVGGSSSAGGDTSTGGGSQGGSTSDQCANPTPEHDADGGLVQVGFTDPSKSVQLGIGAYYAMPNTTFQGHCYTIADKYATDGSTTFPPCGTADTADAPSPPCFTVNTGLCVTQSLGVASGSNVWGAGLGCNLAQEQGHTFIDRADLTGKTNVTVGIYGCSVPPKLQVQLNMHYGTGPSTVDGGTAPGDGYFCKVVDLPKDPDANGVRTITVPISDLTEDCWNPGGPKLDLATMPIEAFMVQVNSDSAKRKNYDFCLSKLSID
jgi:hypothetical protein